MTTATGVNWDALDRPVLRPDRLGTRRTTPTVMCELIWCPGGWPWVFASATAASETECWRQAAGLYGWAEDWIGRRACPMCARRPEFRPAPAVHLPAPYEPPVSHFRPLRVNVPPPATDDTIVLEALRATDIADLPDWVTPDETPLPQRRWPFRSRP